MGELTPKQSRFVDEYLYDLNGAKAAIRAGYAPKWAGDQAKQLLAHPSVENAIAKRQANLLTKTAVDARTVLAQLARIAMVDMRAFFDAQGNLKPVSEWTEDMGACVSSLECVVKNLTSGDGETDKVQKIRLWDKNRALETLSKHFGLLIERIQHQGELVIRWETAPAAKTIDTTQVPVATVVTEKDGT